MSTITTDTYVARISALLDKAERTPYEAEAQAFLAKAQELMARHAIDEAMVASSRPGHDEIVHELIIVEPPYASAKSTLLSAAARANRCRMVSQKRPHGLEYCTVVGHRSDVANVSTLFAALSLQAVRFMLAADIPAHDTPRRFRHAFLLSYGARIGQRLQEAEQSATQSAANAHVGEGQAGNTVAMVLASRAERVDQEFQAAFPNLRFRKVSLSSGAGFASGRSAADRASLNRRGVGEGGRALPPG